MSGSPIALQCATAETTASTWHIFDGLRDYTEVAWRQVQGVWPVAMQLSSHVCYAQVTALVKADVPATFLSSQQTPSERDAVLQELRKAQPTCKLLYLTPEQLVKSSALQDALSELHRRNLLARLVIDEVRSLVLKSLLHLVTLNAAPMPFCCSSCTSSTKPTTRYQHESW